MEIAWSKLNFKLACSFVASVSFIAFNKSLVIALLLVDSEFEFVLPLSAVGSAFSGTLLKLMCISVLAPSATLIRSSHGLIAEASSKAAGMVLLSQHLDQARQDLKLLVLVALSIPALLG